MTAGLTQVIRSTLFAVIFYSMTIPFVVAAALIAPVSERLMQRVATAWCYFHRWSCRILLGQKIRVIGDLPKEPMLFVFKHESMFETIDLLCLLDCPIVIAKQELLDIPMWGAVARRYGAIGLRRDDGAKAVRHLKVAVGAAIHSGRPVCLFPEGTRVAHGHSPPIRAGFAALYQMLGLPVVPVAVDSGRLSPRGSFVKRAGTITYKVGKVVPAGLPRREAEALVHAAINALNGAEEAGRSSSHIGP